MQPYDLNLLRALDALLSTNSVTAAAQRMHLSTPAMSHTLARIRDVFKDPILVRSGRQLVPTPRALALIEPIRALLATAQALRVGEGESWVHDARRFVVRAPESYSVIYGALIARALSERMANASVQLLPSGYLDMTALQEGRIDLDICPRADSMASSEAWIVLARQPLLGVARDKHLIFERPITVKRWAEAEHVDVMRTPNEKLPIDEALAQRGLTRRIKLIAPHAFAAMLAAARSNLVACAPEGMVHSMAPDLGLRFFKLPLPVSQPAMGIEWHPRHQNDPAHRWFRQRLRQLLADPSQHPPSVTPDGFWQNVAAGFQTASDRPVLDP